ILPLSPSARGQTLASPRKCLPLRIAKEYAAAHNATSARRPMSQPGAVRQRDKPWIFRTYAGHSNARDSNALYRKNLAKGQTGLSVAFALPTQTGYDSDHPLAKGEVGKVGVPISHLGDMRTLFEAIPLADMNTSMTINATAAWLLALYVALADEQSAAREKLQGTTQNDIIKEYLSRHLCVSARAFHAAHQGRDTLHHPRDAEMESDQRVLVSPAGSRCHPSAGTCLCARHRDRRARHRASVGRGGAQRLRRGGRAHFVLRQRRAALHHRAVQDARIRRAVGRDHGRALRRQ